MTVRIGLVGAGFLTKQVLLSSLAEARGVTLAAVLDADPRALAGIDAPTTTDEDEFFAEPMAAVHVATSNNAHARYAVRALRQGLATLVDKPIAHTVADGAAIVRAAAGSTAPALMGYMSKLNAGDRAVREVVAAGGIGEPLSMTAAYLGYRDGDWRNRRTDSGLGCLADLAVYPLITATDLFGADPDRCRATAYPAGHEELTDIFAEATIWFGDRTLHLQSSFTDPGQNVPDYSVVGTDGLLRVRGTWAMEGGGSVLLCDSGGRRLVDVHHVNPYTAQYQLLAECAAGRPVPPEVSVEQGLRDLAVLYQLELSAALRGQLMEVEQWIW
jgi:predicted dehydrogenase